MQEKMSIKDLENLSPEDLEAYHTVEFKVIEGSGVNVKDGDIVKLKWLEVPLPFLSFENLTSDSASFFCLADSVQLKVL